MWNASRDGRHNVYSVRRDRPVTLPKQRAIDLNALLDALLPATSSGAHSDELDSSPVSAVA